MNVAEPPELDLGAIRPRWLYGGAFRMDGAAVFGQVPRPIWLTVAHDPDVLALCCGPDGSIAGELRASGRPGQ
jgi:hypothetical protein